MKPKVVLLATGGTIVSSGASETQLTGYRIDALTVGDVVRSVPSLRRVADIEEKTLFSIPSSSIHSGHWIQIVREIQCACDRPDVSGVVITHGTDTMEETAFFLNLVLKTEKPVVMTGSMRPATALSADGPLNLLNAVRVAASSQARGQGVLIVMNGTIGSARDTTKTHTLAVETFQGRDFGTLGLVLDEAVSFFMKSLRPHTVSSEFSLAALEARPLPRVALITAHAEDDVFLAQAALEAGCAGIVHAGCGHGSVSPAMEAALTKASLQGVVVVRASRTPSGPVLRSHERWEKAGFIPSGTLSPQKARILLQLALAQFGPGREKIRECFELY